VLPETQANAIAHSAGAILQVPNLAIAVASTCHSSHLLHPRLQWQHAEAPGERGPALNHDVASPIPVETGQSILVTVTLNFS